MTELCKCVLNLNVDCVATCPIRPNIFATGLYQLKPDSGGGQRLGGVNLHRIRKRRKSQEVDRDSQEVDHNSDHTHSNRYSDSNLFRIQNLNTNMNMMNSDGVFQIKWLPDKFSLCSVLSTGQLDLYEFEYDFDQSESEYGYRLNSFKLSDDRMLLDLDLIRVGDSYKFIVSDNVGGLHSGNIDSGSPSVNSISHWSAHNFGGGIPLSPAAEVWCCCFSPHGQDLIYSGSERGDLKAWDLRQQQRDSVDSEKSALRQNQCHQAGLTSIACHPEHQNLVFTGGYDDTIKVWDVRQMKKLRPLVELNLGGGVWRIKFDQSDSSGSKLLCSCMYNGWALLKFDWSTTNLHIINSVNYQDALLYGIDWCLGNAGQFLCCTFYDNTVRLVQLPDNS